MRWLTVTHAKRWHAHYHSSGSGALYQGRFKSFPIEEDDHFLTVCRYVERNALRAKLVDRAEEWRWSSLWHRVQESNAISLAAWPVAAGKEWVPHVNRVETEAELKAVRRSVVRGMPFGEAAWVQRTARRLCLDSTLRSRGRPKKETPRNA
jgi:putative transposase